jgi:hypothetical protein
MCRGEAVLLHSGEEWRQGPAAVDEDGRPAGLVADDVGVREPLGMHAALDEHPGRLTVMEVRFFAAPTDAAV